MAKKDRYNYSSPVAAGLGLAVTGAVSMIPAATTMAGPLGTIATGLFGGVDLTDEEMNIKKKFDEAINKTWDQIYDDYKLTDVCFSKLKQDVIGENTSTDEFVDNTQRKKLEESYTLVIQTILEKYKGGLKRKSKKTWDDEYIKNASKDIASRLVSTLQNVFSEDDLLKILKAIADRSKDIRGDIAAGREASRLEHEKLMKVLGEISDSIKSKRVCSEIPPALTTIPAPPEKLIGREKAIEEIQGLLAQNKIVYIHAHGGVGKTAVAAQIASRINDGDGPYKHTAWIISTGNLKADLIGLNIPGVSAKQTPEEKYKIVSTFLQTTPTFLVIDNMDDPPVIEINELNTISGRTKILITSRANISIGKPYELEDLDSDSALLLFYWYFRKGKNLAIDQINKQEDKSYAQNIVEAATYNALFIELIAKMAYADHWKLDALWKELEKDIFGKNSRHKITAGHGDDGRLLAHIQKLYEMSGLSGRQKEIMSFFSMFPAEHSIFFDVFEWAGFEDDEVDNLGELERRGWIERGNDGYLIHTMVKGSIEQQGKVVFDEDKYESLINNLADTDQYMSVDRGYTVIRERIVIPETICKLLANQGSEKIITSTLFNNIAGVYRVLGNYAETLKYYNLALSIREEKLGKEDPDTATTYNNIAGVYKDQGNYAEALKYYNLALSIREEKSGKDHLDTATTYQNIALVYSAQGNYAKALEFYKQALSIREEKSGKDHLDTAVIYHNIAGVYKAQGNYVEALKYYNQALSIRKEKLIRAHPDTAMTYNNIAGVYRAQGNYAEALKYYNLALSIREEKLGKEHPDTATTYNNIAGVYEEQGKYAEALRYFNEALSIYVEKLEKDHPYIATIYNNMALVNSALGNYAEALQLYNLALSIREGKLGKDHPSTATTYNNIGRAYAGLGNYAEAMNYYSLALSIREEKLGKDHPFTAATYNNIGRAYAGLGNYAEAMNYYSHALSIHEKKLGKDHPSTATTYDNMGVLYYQMHDYEKAKDYLERAMVIREKVLGPDHPYTKNTKASLELVHEEINTNRMM